MIIDKDIARQLNLQEIDITKQLSDYPVFSSERRNVIAALLSLAQALTTGEFDPIRLIFGTEDEEGQAIHIFRLEFTKWE